MDDQVAQGPALVPKPRGPHDFTRFDRILATLEGWRNEDHNDNIVVHRSQIIEIIEGIKALRARSSR